MAFFLILLYWGEQNLSWANNELDLYRVLRLPRPVRMRLGRGLTEARCFSFLVLLVSFSYRNTEDWCTQCQTAFLQKNLPVFGWIAVHWIPLMVRTDSSFHGKSTNMPFWYVVTFFNTLSDLLWNFINTLYFCFFFTGIN